MLLNELLLESTSIGKIEVKPIGNDWSISTKEKSGKTLDVIIKAGLLLGKKSGIKLTSASGKEYGKNNMSDLFKSRPSKIVVSFSKPKDDAEDYLKSIVDTATKTVNKQIASAEKYKATAPQRKKEAAAFKRESDKAKKSADDEQYGKGTLQRITVKQEGGDDGYQYAVRVDGKLKVNGLTKREAEAKKKQFAIEIAKKEKIGKYS